MNDQYVRNVIEAALLAAGRPLAADELVGLFDERDGSAADEVRTAIAVLQSDYETRGIELVEVASGFRIQIRSAVAQPVSRLWQERPTKYSRALLETLALVAYRQPITRGEIEQIRGVTVNPNIIKTLLERSWIRVIGHRDVPGRPELLGTTRDFLDYFGLQKLDDLPTLAQLKELEDLRVQLSLPGAEPAVESTDPVAAETESSEASAAADAADAADSADEDELEAAQADEPRPQGLVARPASDDTDGCRLARHARSPRAGGGRAARGAPAMPPSAASPRPHPSGCKKSCPRRVSARGARLSAGFGKGACASMGSCRRSARSSASATASLSTGVWCACRRHPARDTCSCITARPALRSICKKPRRVRRSSSAYRKRGGAGSPFKGCRPWMAASSS
jgi:segregation and condensation protein B